MHIRSLSRVVLPAVLVSLLAAASFAQTPIGSAPPAKATVSQVAFIAGAWVGTLGDRTIEQHWMEPLGSSMIAMYRNVQGTEPRLYELLAI